MCSPLSFASNSLSPTDGRCGATCEKLALLASRSGKFPIRHRSHVVFQKDSTQKFANSRIRSTAVMDRVHDPFVLERVPNFVDVAFAEDVVNRLKRTVHRKNRFRAMTRLKLTAKNSFLSLHHV